jgi:hypothetical protein
VYKPYSAEFLERAGRRLAGALGEEPAPPVHRLARELGCHPATLYRHHYALCREVAARALLEARRRSMERDEALREQVREVMRALKAEGEYPSSVRVAQHMQKAGRMCDPVAQAEWREMLHRLGYKQ